MNRLTLQAVVVLILASIGAGCGALWQGDWEQDGDRRIYLYEVKPGDTLRGIAWRHGLQVDQLVSWNEIENPDQIQVGRKLVLNPPRGVGDADESRQARADEPTTDPPPPPKDTPEQELDWQWPARGEIIRAYATDSGGKSGIQIGGEEGQTIRAASSGEVVYSGSGLRGYGNLIIIMHDDNYVSAYGYNRALLVGEGDQVSKGDSIAEMGYASGADRASLHFEIRIDGRAVDPEDYLPER
ncbi:peptidoglycan DD-metalloendopeptidase family protein [Halorhodospira halochloris]|uniref:peptidoglycan DD-metalloendopeptidase family protein n=1 Tax=Halorhodospira halochloris TaxID=1052 RepID=UPI001EE853C7|nr:peptidoglycan DD-metalloendopeptidase family protein [Halorhodospira halochloris]MCG5530734.1 peptidoglycan DD-metalloendopeptidase family protein [Halorhodospira halochloris]MCG5547635.1 peptidoglycan DD-metalloendopeptidase family protein [Halorhodospira halochloris]